MSWSIYLSGRKSIVSAELEHAIKEIRRAVDAIDDMEYEEVSATVSGYGYEGSDGGVQTISNSFSVSGMVPPKAVVDPMEVVEAETPVIAADKSDYPF